MITSYDIFDYFWQIVRLAILGSLMYFSCEAIKFYGHSWYLSHTWAAIMSGIIFGFLVYNLMMEVFYKFMYLAFKCEPLGNFDSIFLLDDKKNVANIMAACFLEEFEFESMKKYIFDRVSLLHKCHSKQVKHLGLWWYQEMS
jgi:hypothetical protein